MSEFSEFPVEETSALDFQLRRDVSRRDATIEAAEGGLGAPEVVDFLSPDRQRAIFEALPEPVAMVDRHGVIVETNPSWSRMVEGNAFFGPNSGSGVNYVDACFSVTGAGAEEARAVGQGIQEVLSGRRRQFSHVYATHAGRERRWFEARIFACADPAGGEGAMGATILHTDITARALSEEAARASEERFRTTFAHAAVGIGHLNLEGRWLKANERLCEITGWTAEELQQKTILDLTHPEDLEPLVRAQEELLSGVCESCTLEQRCLRRNGDAIWGQLTATLVRNSARAPEYLVIAVDDITQRKDAEVRLLRASRLYTVLGRINEAIVRTRTPQELYDRACRIAVEEGGLLMTCVMTLDLSGKEAHPAASFGADSGYLTNLRATVGRGMIGASLRSGGHDVCNDVAKDPRMAPWRDAALERGYRAAAAFAIQIDGRITGAIVYFAGQTEYFRDGEIRLMHSISADLSFALATMEGERKRRRAEEALRASEQQFASAFEHASIGIALVSLDGRWMDANRALCRMLGYSQEELRGRTFHEITHPDDLEADLVQVRKILAGQILTYEMEKRYTHAQGNLVWGLLSVSLVRDPMGQPLHFISQIQDITQRKDAEARVQRQIQELERWRAATLGREERIQMLKREVNDLLSEAGQPPRYASQTASVSASRREAAGASTHS